MQNLLFCFLFKWIDNINFIRIDWICKFFENQSSIWRITKFIYLFIDDNECANLSSTARTQYQKQCEYNMLWHPMRGTAYSSHTQPRPYAMRYQFKCYRIDFGNKFRCWWSMAMLLLSSNLVFEIHTDVDRVASRHSSHSFTSHARRLVSSAWDATSERYLLTEYGQSNDKALIYGYFVHLVLSFSLSLSHSQFLQSMWLNRRATQL